MLTHHQVTIGIHTVHPLLQNVFSLFSHQVVFGAVQRLCRGHLSGRSGDASRHCRVPPAMFLLLRVFLQTAEGGPLCAHGGQAALCQRLSQHTG